MQWTFFLFNVGSKSGLVVNTFSHYIYLLYTLGRLSMFYYLPLLRVGFFFGPIVRFDIWDVLKLSFSVSDLLKSHNALLISANSQWPLTLGWTSFYKWVYCISHTEPPFPHVSYTYADDLKWHFDPDEFWANFVGCNLCMLDSNDTTYAEAQSR